MPDALGFLTPAIAMRVALAVAVLAPLLCALAVGITVLARPTWPGEDGASRTIRAGLLLSVAASAVAIPGWLGAFGAPVRGDLDFGNWLSVGNYSVPAVLLVDPLALAFSLLSATLTALVGRFSRTYLHREPGFVRFHVLLGLFAGGAQLVAFAGALDLLFAGWEMIGISSALFIGFFHDRDEPVRSSVRAFATYRLCDAGLLVALVTTHELLGSTRLSALANADTLPVAESTAIALLFLLSAMGKSAQLPFSGWLPRAMEGPTPSSALFYGAVSIHTGLYLMLRVAPVTSVAPIAATVGVLVGLATAAYAASVARVHPDAKGALAHATLAQVGLILAEISLGLTKLALVHLVCHALLRSWQYLRTPNIIHDTHQHGHAAHGRWWLARLSPRLAQRAYAAGVHRLRLDERIDAAVAPAHRRGRRAGARARARARPRGRAHARLALARWARGAGDAAGRHARRADARRTAVVVGLGGGPMRDMFAGSAATQGLGIVFACAVTLLLAPRLVERGTPADGAPDAAPAGAAGWIGDLLMIALFVVALVARDGTVALAAGGATAIVLAAMVARASRTAAAWLVLSALASGVTVGAVMAGQPRAAFVASIVAIALRTGIFPFQAGVAALTDRSVPLQVRQVATLPVLVLVHLRWVNLDPLAYDLAPLLVAVGTLSTLGFALVALAQRSLEGLLRASMLMHGGMLFAAVGAAGRGHHAAALLVAITLGLALSGFGLMLAAFAARVGPLGQLAAGGRARAYPRLAASVAVFGGAAVGLPGTAGFVADDLLLHALWQESVGSAVLTIVASALLAVATLAGFARAFLGRPIPQLAPDLLGGERTVAVLLLGWLVVLGVAPGLLVTPLTVLLP